MRLFAVLLLLLLSSSVSSSSRDWITVQFSGKQQVQAMLKWARRYFGSMLQHTELELDLGRRYEGLDATVIPLNAIQEEPYVSIGKLYYRVVGDSRGNRFCTAFFISDDVLMTAAHCVMGVDGRWREDIVFLGNVGTENAEFYSIQCIALPVEWGNSSDEEVFAYDFAMLKTTRSSDRSYLSLVASSASAAEKVRIIGYGSELYNRMIELKLGAEFHAERSHLSVHGNPMASGSSGSPWIDHQFNVVSISSHFEGLSGSNLNGPVFDEQVESLREYVAGGCAG